MAEKKENRFKVLGGSLFLKIIVLLAIGLIAFAVLAGMPYNLSELLWFALQILVGVVLLVLVFKGIQSVFKPKPFSPTESFTKKIIRIAEQAKPFNVKELYIRGEDMRVYSKWGKITGLCFIPYICSKTKLDKKGNIIMVPKKNKDGEELKDKDTGKPILTPQREILTEKDGDWCFVIQVGTLPAFSRKELVRAHYSLCSAMGERVWIKSPNLVPIGDYFYPTQQWQEDIIRIKTQHQSEALIETHEEFLDLLAHVTQMSLGSDPTFQKIMLSQSEAIASRHAGAMMRENV